MIWKCFANREEEDSSLAGSALEGPAALRALLAVGLSFCSTFTVTDEVQYYSHLLVEPQRFDRDDLPLPRR